MNSKRKDKNSGKKKQPGTGKVLVYFVLIIESSTEYLYALTPNLSNLNSDPDFQRWQLHI